jgi:hypothetical protein
MYGCCGLAMLDSRSYSTQTSSTSLLVWLLGDPDIEIAKKSGDRLYVVR